ncbi:hypothetical protein QTP88_003386 [Uroleucon formosanum]
MYFTLPVEIRFMTASLSNFKLVITFRSKLFLFNEQIVFKGDNFERRKPPNYRDNNNSPERQHRRHNSNSDDDDCKKRPRHDRRNNSRHQGKSDSDHVWVAKKKPNFETTGKLAEDMNTFNGVARKPKRRWRLYSFKGEKQLPVFHIHRQCGYLLGRDRRHGRHTNRSSSCSKQDAVLQYRQVSAKKDGRHVRCIWPYIIDLESANGTYINNQLPGNMCFYMNILYSTGSGDDDSLAEDNPNEESNADLM